jgi:hypothetical protein
VIQEEFGLSPVWFRSIEFQPSAQGLGLSFRTANSTVALLRRKCAFRLNPVFDQVVRRLIEEGKVQAKAIKLELSLSR